MVTSSALSRLTVSFPPATSRKLSQPFTPALLCKQLYLWVQTQCSALDRLPSTKASELSLVNDVPSPNSALASQPASYSHRIGSASDAVCPECRVRRQTTKHLFACEDCPTSLCVEDLWRRPTLVMEFLFSLPSFSLIPRSPSPPPPPTPDPPSLSPSHPSFPRFSL